MFNSNRLPTGLTLTQAKKDAKKLAKQNQLTFSESLETFAFLHGRATWATLMQRLNHPLSLIPGQEPFDNKKYNRSLLVIVGMSGSGKTQFQLNSALSLLEQGESVLMITRESIDSQQHHPDADALSLKPLIQRFPDKLMVVDPGITPLDEIMLNGRVLMIADNVAWESINHKALSSLIKASMHTVVAAYDLNDLQTCDVLPLKDDHVHCQILLSRNTRLTKKLWWAGPDDINLLTSHLFTKPREFADFLLIEPSKIRILRQHIPELYHMKIPTEEQTHAVPQFCDK